MRLGDGFVQSSSIMPQKRNPVAFEHARAIGSKALGQAQAIVLSVHNTPFGDIVDTEDDLQPLVFSMFRDATRTVKLVAAAMRTVEFDAAKLEARAGDGWATLTELADRSCAITACRSGRHTRIAARVMPAGSSDPDASLSALLADAPPNCTGRRCTTASAELADILSPRHFVEVRKTLGGPAPGETAPCCRRVTRRPCETDQAWWTACTQALADAERQLAHECGNL